MAHVGHLVAGARTAEALSQAELSTLTGIRLRRLQRIEWGDARLLVSELDILRKHLPTLDVERALRRASEWASNRDAESAPTVKHAAPDED